MGPIVESLESQFSQQISKCKGHQHSGSQMLISISALETSGWPGESQVLCFQDILRAPRARGLWEAKSQTQIPQSTWKLWKHYPMKVNRSLFKEEEMCFFETLTCHRMVRTTTQSRFPLQVSTTWSCVSRLRETDHPAKKSGAEGDWAVEQGAQWENVCLAWVSPRWVQVPEFQKESFC